MALFVGFQFPFQKGPTGFPAQATDNDLIKQSLVQLILTGRGERVMRPTVGSGAYSFIFENNEVPLVSLLQAEIQNTIAKWEPRVLVQSIDVVQGDATDNVNGPASVIVTINYVVLATQQTQQLEMTVGGS